MLLHALGQEAFTTALAAPGQGCTSTFGAHAGTKTVLLLACAFGGLECAFHMELCGRRNGAGMLRSLRELSIAPGIDLRLA